MKLSKRSVKHIMESYEALPHSAKPGVNDMANVFQLCRNNQWGLVQTSLEETPLLGATPMVMDNHITTTILHQAITSKGDVGARARVIFQILLVTPQAAGIKNGYGSLPLHVACQRNVKMDASTKEKVIACLIKCDPTACVEEGGVGKRTPLHILFTDYISPSLTRLMIETGSQACFMRDKRGYLPAHVACSRHCSPEKLRMLLSVYPMSLYEKTYDGHTLMSLAKSTATKSHPNYALIEELHRQLQAAGPDLSCSDLVLTSEESSVSTRGRFNSNDSDKCSDLFWYDPNEEKYARKRKYHEVIMEKSPQPIDSPACAEILLEFARNSAAPSARFTSFAEV